MISGLLEPSFSRALVTGGSGFIGRSLVRRLRSAGVEVTCASRHRGTGAPPGTKWITGDVRNRSFVHGLVSSTNADVIFHLAARVTGSRDVAVVAPTLGVNLMGSVNVLLSATQVGCERLVLIGSGDEPAPREWAGSPYAAAKAGQSSYAMMFHHLYDTPVSTARVFMAYGPDQPDESKIVPYSITSLLRGEPPAVSSGIRRCDWIYIDDVVNALIVVAQTPDATGEVVDVGTGILHSVRHVVETILELTGSSAAPRFGALADRRAEPEHVADAAATSELTGWSASTDLDAGLARTVSWYETRLREGSPRSMESPIGF